MNQNLTIVLTSTQNYVWSSMQEIIPHIVRCWEKTKGSSHNVEVIDVDKTPLKSIAKQCWQAQNIVISCFNFQIASVLRVLKKDMGIPARLIFHLHNQATIALWPLQEFGILPLFTGNDLFVSSANRDWESLKQSVHSPKGGVVIFSLAEKELITDTHKAPEENELYFAGRISRQKNLHSIIEALHILKQKNIYTKFHIFGDEDFLGSPNMGVKDPSYKQELVELIHKFNLQELVIFHGKVDRTELYQSKLKNRKIFISPSAHSDENFGIAAFRALCRGERLILSDWGGHTDYQQNFPTQIEYVDIIPANENGLTCGPSQIAEAIIKTLEKNIPAFSIPPQYFEDNISKQYFQLLKNPIEVSSPLKLTSLFEKIIDRRAQFKPHPTRIFHDYNDPLAQELFKAYGLKQQV
jgi:glycosyltransferase involved in cell wall biosynthesis